jgi:O-antigen ligase
VLQARGHAWMRGYGLTPSPNILGACLAILIIILLPLVLSRYRALPGAQRLLLTLAITGGVLGLLASFSRAAWLGFALGASVCIWTVLSTGRRIPSHSPDAPGAQRLSSWWLAPVLAALAFIVVYGDLAASRLIHLDAPTEARSLDERERDASLALDMIQVHPFLGVGTGNYAPTARAVNPDAQVVHSVPLLVTAEWGLHGVALWLALAVIGLCKRSDVRPAWLALLVISLFDLSLWPTTSWHGAILFGLLMAQMSGDSFPRAEHVTARVGNYSGER